MDMRVSAYGVIIGEDDRVLLAHWVEGRRHSWTLPGGGLEPGEDPEAAAIREVFEETGFHVELEGLLGIRSHVIAASRRLSPERAGIPLHVLQIVYRARIVGGELRNEIGGSTDRADWFAVSDVPTLRHVKLVAAGLDMAGR